MEAEIINFAFIYKSRNLNKKYASFPDKYIFLVYQHARTHKYSHTL